MRGAGTIGIFLALTGAPGVWAACAPLDLERIEAEAVESMPPAPPPDVTVVYDPDRLAGEGRSPSIPPDILRHVMQAMTEDCAEEDPDRNPLADTVFLRHPGLLPPLSDTVRRRMVAAEIARGTAVALDLLAPLIEEGNPPFVRYRALLETMLRFMRAPREGDGSMREWLALARTLVPGPTGEVDPAADLDFIEGRLCLDLGGGIECRPHLDAALGKDGWFVAARQLRIGLIDIQLREIRSVPPPDRRCDALLGTLLADTESILRGVRSPRGVIAVADALDARADAGNIALFMGAAYAYDRGNAVRKAGEAFADAEAGLERDFACNATIRERLDDFRTLVFGP